MSEELEKTCENCEYENEGMEGTHCRKCIHNAIENFVPKINHEKEIRTMAIDEFAERLKKYLNQFDFWKYGLTDGVNYEERNYDYTIDEVAKMLKGGAK